MRCQSGPLPSKKTKSPTNTAKGLRSTLHDSTSLFFFFFKVNPLPASRSVYPQLYRKRKASRSFSVLHTGGPGEKSPSRNTQTEPFTPPSAIAQLPPTEREAGRCRAASRLCVQCRSRQPPQPGKLRGWQAKWAAGSGETRVRPARSHARGGKRHRPAPLRPEGREVQPRRPRARAPAARPRPRLWPPRPPRPALTPVPLSHTTTFLPWLSIVRPGESRCRRTTYSRRRPAVFSSSSFVFPAPPSAQLFSPDRKSPPGSARHLAECLHEKGGTGGQRDWQR